MVSEWRTGFSTAVLHFVWVKPKHYQNGHLTSPRCSSLLWWFCGCLWVPGFRSIPYRWQTLATSIAFHGVHLSSLLRSPFSLCNTPFASWQCQDNPYGGRQFELGGEPMQVELLVLASFHGARHLLMMFLHFFAYILDIFFMISWQSVYAFDHLMCMNDWNDLEWFRLRHMSSPDAASHKLIAAPDNFSHYGYRGQGIAVSPAEDSSQFPNSLPATHKPWVFGFGTSKVMICDHLWHAFGMQPFAAFLGSKLQTPWRRLWSFRPST